MKRLLIGMGALLALGIMGCEPATRQDVEEIKAQQAEILAKLASIEEAQKKTAQAAPARRGPPPEDYSKVHKIDVSGAPMLGNPNAPITLVEYSDFQCPYCARTAPDVKAVLDKYPEKVRIVYKHFPLSFHQAAKPAAVASLAAQEQGKFWEFHDVIFQATADRSLSGSDEDMFKYAEKAGLDVEQFKKDLTTNRAAYEKRVNQDYVEGQRADVRGTPTLYLNGQKVQNRSVPGISARIDEILKQPDS